MHWTLSNRADPEGVKIADRHYNRQKIGSPQFVPPGRCAVLINTKSPSLWVTSWPFAQYVKHAWAGAWVNSLFRHEGQELASDLILDAVAATRCVWDPLELRMITFVDPKTTPGTGVRGEDGNSTRLTSIHHCACGMPSS